MRKLIVVAVMMMAMVAARGAQAQLTDPSTGMTVNASDDPMDFADVAAGQPGNIGTEAAAAAQETFAAMDAQVAAAQQISDDAMASLSNNMNNNSNDDSDNDDAAVPAIPVTLKPQIAPNGGKVVAGTAVALRDADAAAVIYYTIDGKKPTMASARYDAPIVVNAKEKVRAMAFDVNDQPSSVVSKTFKVKS